MQFNTEIVGPRIVNGVLKWKEGDTFIVRWKVSLFEGDSEIIYREGDEFIVSFYREKSDKVVYSFLFSKITNINSFYLVFNAKVTQFFKAGCYSYCLKFLRKSEEGSEVITVGSRLLAEVERCH